VWLVFVCDEKICRSVLCEDKVVVEDIFVPRMLCSPGRTVIHNCNRFGYDCLCLSRYGILANRVLLLLKRLQISNFQT